MREPRDAPSIAPAGGRVNGDSGAEVRGCEVCYGPMAARRQRYDRGERSTGGDFVDTTDLTSRLEQTAIPSGAAEVLRQRLAQASGAQDLARLRRALDLPWDGAAAERPRLDELHDSLVSGAALPESAADLIIDYLAVRERQLAAGAEAAGPRPLLCLAGPSGVGKSHVARRVAASLGLPLEIVALDRLASKERLFGGAEAPGAIMRAVERRGSGEIALLLENLGGEKGGSASPLALSNALTDAEALRQFRDRFFDVPFDLSRMLVMATTRWLPDVDPVWRERLDVVELAGYLDDDKVEIARDSLLPAVLAEYQAPPDDLIIEDEALSALVRSYTEEPGVAALDGLVRRLVRRALSRRAMDGGADGQVIAIENLAATIGRPARLSLRRRGRDVPGLAAAAVVRSSGGVLGRLEAVQMPGRGVIRVLDTAGADVSRQYAIMPSYVRSRLSALEVSARSLEEFDTDLLLPANQLPGDEGSLAIAAAIAMVSLMRDRPADAELLAIGGMSAHGRVRSARGVHAKVLAAHRGGIRRVLLPRQNEHDLDSLPARLHDAITFIPIEDAGQAINVALR